MKYVASVSIALLMTETTVALASWDLKYRDWEKAELGMRLGYLDGFLQGHLLYTHLGDQKAVRERFKTCLAFASPSSIEHQMRETVKLHGGAADLEFGQVVMTTLFRMCGTGKHKATP